MRCSAPLEVRKVGPLTLYVSIGLEAYRESGLNWGTRHHRRLDRRDCNYGKRRNEKQAVYDEPNEKGQASYNVEASVPLAHMKPTRCSSDCVTCVIHAVGYGAIVVLVPALWHETTDIERLNARQ